MDLTQRVKQLALDQQIDFVRIAPVERFEHAPEGHKPTDLLEGAQSVIVVGMRLLEGVRRANILGHEKPEVRHALYSYLWFGYGNINLHFLDRTSHLIARLLEREGHVSVPIVASGVDDNIKYMGALSNRHAAVCAGVGQFGWNTLCVTDIAGPRQRFGSVITTAKLEPDPLYEGPQICDVDKCKSIGKEKYGVAQPICVKVCPMNALSEDNSVSLTIGNKTFTYARLDKRRCVWAGMGLHKDAGALRHVEPPEVIDAEAIAWGRSQRHPGQVLEMMVVGRSHYCGRCITHCPIALVPISSKGAPHSPPT